VVPAVDRIRQRKTEWDGVVRGFEKIWTVSRRCMGPEHTERVKRKLANPDSRGKWSLKQCECVNHLQYLR